MPLRGKAAMILSFDVSQDAIREHDDWHTHEHLSERLAIPGFVRGSRWVALTGTPRYFVMYEVDALEVLSSPAYLERLNNPSPWTTKMMPNYRAMARGFCTVMHSVGAGFGYAGLLLRFKPEPAAEDSLRAWLQRDILSPIPTCSGLGSAHLLAGARSPEMTKEQSIRGADAGVDWTLFICGFNRDALEQLSRDQLSKKTLEQHGATGVMGGIYRLDYALTREELGEPGAGL